MLLLMRRLQESLVSISSVIRGCVGVVGTVIAIALTIVRLLGGSKLLKIGYPFWIVKRVRFTRCYHRRPVDKGLIMLALVPGRLMEGLAGNPIGGIGVCRG